MSYDICLYDKAFLRTAIKQDLGDYTDAPPFPRDLIGAIKQRLMSMGYSI
jgi:hypothetical protein